MNKRSLMFVSGLTLAVLTASMSTAVAAAKPRISSIPARLYPARSTITHQPNLSNYDMDCMWGFFCEGPKPLFHFQRQDQLGRIAGFAQTGGTNHLRFELFASSYAPQEGAELASLDMRNAAAQSGYQPVPAPTACIALRGWQVYVLACSSGSNEFEGIVGFYGASRVEKRAGVVDLIKQAQYFLAHT